MLRETLTANATGFIETGFSWFAKESRLKPLVELTGKEYLDAAKAKGNGVLLIGGHFTNLDLGGRLFALHYDFDVTYRPHSNPVLEYIIFTRRQKSFAHVIERQNMRQLLKSLKSGRIVWYAADQDYGRKHSVFAPFFGIPAASINATPRLVKANNSEVLFLSHIRKKDNSGYLLELSKPLENYPSGDDVADATQINHALENAIVKAPEQYMWVHRRFKTRPDGAKKFYDTGYQAVLNSLKQ